MISASHALGVPVAAHATNRYTILQLLDFGVDSIEHGFDMLEDFPFTGKEGKDDIMANLLVDAFKRAKAKWVPTIAAAYTISPSPSDPGRGGHYFRALDAVKRMIAAGMPDECMAVGGDTGVFAHGDGALEMKLLVRAGIPWTRVLRWATLGGWECIFPARFHIRPEQDDEEPVVNDKLGINEVKFGAIRRGWAADIIGISGDLEKDFEAAVDKDSVAFVMKAGKLYKVDGRDCSA